MSASLVGSEMCIRDRAVRCALQDRWCEIEVASEEPRAPDGAQSPSNGADDQQVVSRKADATLKVDGENGDPTTGTERQVRSNRVAR
eukprot:7325885-Alexandrium_andersonii.AAC.1